MIRRAVAVAIVVGLGGLQAATHSGCANGAAAHDAGAPSTSPDGGVVDGEGGPVAAPDSDAGLTTTHDAGPAPVPTDASASSHDAERPGADAGTVSLASDDVLPQTALTQPAVARASKYRGFAERFNRYYTEPTWQASKTVYVSPGGTGDGSSMTSPSSVQSALSTVVPGTKVFFLSGSYSGCFELQNEHSGSYDAPVVLYGQRTPSGARSVTINCCTTNRQSCFNLENANYVAVDGFELVGGNYGVRAVGADYAATQHQRGVAVLDCEGHEQARDPFFTGQSDWYVIERSLAYNAGSGDGHGIYLSNGSDWNIARNNELWNNRSADFQINADPNSACGDVGIALNSADCDALAGTPGDGGRGVSDFFLVEDNFFHDGLAQGANFTSVRHSIVRNNIFAVYAKHGVSFWQETDNPKLGSSDNQVLHNLFVAKVANRQMLQFVLSSDRNAVENNVFVGVGTGMLAMEVDDTVAANQYRNNRYLNAALSGRTVSAEEQFSSSLDPVWFQALPAAASRDANAWRPSATAPFLDQGRLLPNAQRDRTGKARGAPSDLGPFER